MPSRALWVLLALALVVRQAEGTVDTLFVRSIPDIYVPANTSLSFSVDLDNYLVAGYPESEVTWNATFDTGRLQVIIQPRTHVLAILRVGNWIGSERVDLTATGLGGAVVRRSPNIVYFVPPSITGLPDTTLASGRAGIVLKLGSFFVAGTSDSVRWSVEGASRIQVTIDGAGRTATLAAPAGFVGVEKLTFVVQDPYGGQGKAAMSVRAVLPGVSPVLSAFPEIRLFPGETDTSVLLSSYVFDPDTPDSLIRWTLVYPEPRRLDVTIDGRTSRLRVALPFGRVEAGNDSLILAAMDDTYSTETGRLLVTVIPDNVAPEFTLNLLKNPLLPTTLAIGITPSEELSGPPQVEADGVRLSVDTLSHAAGPIPTYSVTYDPAGDSAFTLRIYGVDRNGNEGELERAVSVLPASDSGVPDRYLLFQCQPNPVGERGTLIAYQVPRRGPLTLRVYNLRGDVVRTLLNGGGTVGILSVRWDGKDEKGRRVPNGVYLYRLEAGRYRVTRKLAVVR